MPTRLKFKSIKRHELVVPNGYRLATVEEVKNNFETIKSRRLVQGLSKTEAMGLLDGHILHDNRVDYRVDYSCILCDGCILCDSSIVCNGHVVVKIKERDEEEGVWKKNCSACYPENGNLLRKQLYDGIILSQQKRETALTLASYYGRVEVIYWLFKTTNPIEVQGFINLLKNLGNLGKNRHIWGLLTDWHTFNKMLEFLFASKFPLELQNEQDNLCRRTLDHFITFYAQPEFIVFFIELLIEVFSTDIFDCITQHGMTFLDKITDKAINDREWFPVLTKLLSVSQHSIENQVSKIQHRFGDICIEAVERGYAQLVENLLKLEDYVKQLTSDACLEVATGAIRKGYLQCLPALLNLLKQKVGNELQQDKHGKTFFHYAADLRDGEVFRILAATYQDEYKVKKMDKRGRNFLHWAALNGQADFCKFCVDELQLKVDAKDIFGQNSLHFAAKGKKGHLVVDYLVGTSSVDLVYARDDEGRTPLHFASAKGNMETVEKLLSFVADKMKHYIQQADGFGKTALQMAAGGGHIRIVRLFLDKECDVLSQRDVHGSTALHYATQAKDAEVAFAISQSLLNKYEDKSKQKSLLLWASAAGIGTAEERKGVDPFVKDFFLREKARCETHLLKAAAKTNNVEMAWELLNRGAGMEALDDYRTFNDQIMRMPDMEFFKRMHGTDEEINNAKKVIKEIEIAKEHGRDKPSLEDNLGRNVFAEGLAALFMNRFIESPITVGISGEWGMGKSSLMIQTENILLMAASQLSFPNLLPSENFVGAEKISLSSKGRKIYKRMKNALNKLLRYQGDYQGDYHKDGLLKLLGKYHSQYHAIYKSLACMDIYNQMLSSDVNRESQFQAMRGVPRILAIRYNAWHYRDEHEAWAGLAVTITKEIEQAMTRAQWFGTCWRYSWAKNSVKIYVEIFLPCLLATFLAGWVAWAAWTLLKDAKFKDLKYGSIPCTIIAIVWVVLKSVISVVKPVSIQMMGYINSPDHTARLGYQEQVISDINFLKGELGKKPHWFFSFVSGEWCRNWFGLYPDNVENTCVPKFRPASEDELRMITFVDDLDRCDEKVIIQVLSAINLVLAECKINVILGIDKKMIQRAVERHFEDNADKDLAEKFICKIIQIPLSLPDPTDEESDKFLQHRLGHLPPIRTTTRVEDGEDTDYGDIDTDNDADDEKTTNESPKKESTMVNIDCSNGVRTSCQGIIEKVLDWLASFFQIMWLLDWLASFFQIMWLLDCNLWLACNLSSQLRQERDELKEKQIRTMAFSKGARLTREMLMSNYSLEEADTLYKLKGFATGIQKLPREWKRFLDYRTFAFNSLSIIGKVYRLQSWRVELVAWTFICWQWKHEMNNLIKGWHRYAVVQSKSLKGEDEVEHWYGPSLKQIVMNYVIELQESQQNSDIEVGLDRERKLNSRTIETQTIEESQARYFNWLNLLKALDIQDVSMKGIQLFQQFRLHCETNHLPWPLPELNYSPEEADTLYKLKRFATSRQKIPHEHFLDYHKFACHILSIRGKVHSLPGWKVQLVAWIFICWQWKHEMNTLIKGWHKYAIAKSKDKGKSMEGGDEAKEHQDGPSLREIVMNYMEVNFNKDGRTLETQEGFLKFKECLRQDPFVKSILCMYGQDITTMEESQTQYSNWLNLLGALNVQDVSMRGIQLFQKFRLHCEIDHLPWPLPSQMPTNTES